MKYIFSALTICISLWSCSKKEKPLINTTDPFASALWGKRIKYLLEENSDAGYDTTRLDSAGNIAEIESYGIAERYRYNSQHFIERYLYKGDVMENYVISYQHKGQDSLIQTWLKLPHNSWTYDKSDIDSTNFHTITFRADQEGRIIQEVDTMRSLIKNYYYHQGILLKSEEKNLRDNTVSKTTLYKYDNSIISKIEIRYHNDMVIDTYVYSGGLPASRTRTLEGYGTSTKKIKCIY